jgi:hypothetical protein
MKQDADGRQQSRFACNHHEYALEPAQPANRNKERNKPTIATIRNTYLECRM